MDLLDDCQQVMLCTEINSLVYIETFLLFLVALIVRLINDMCLISSFDVIERFPMARLGDADRRLSIFLHDDERLLLLPLVPS